MKEKAWGRLSAGNTPLLHLLLFLWFCYLSTRRERRDQWILTCFVILLVYSACEGFYSACAGFWTMLTCQEVSGGSEYRATHRSRLPSPCRLTREPSILHWPCSIWRHSSWDVTLLSFVQCVFYLWSRVSLTTSLRFCIWCGSAWFITRKEGKEL